MNDELKFWVFIILGLSIFILAICVLVGWGNDVGCSRFMAENPDKDFRTFGIEKACEVNYKGLWVSVDEFRYGLSLIHI